MIRRIVLAICYAGKNHEHVPINRFYFILCCLQFRILHEIGKILLRRYIGPICLEEKRVSDRKHFWRWKTVAFTWNNTESKSTAHRNINFFAYASAWLRAYQTISICTQSQHKQMNSREETQCGEAEGKKQWERKRKHTNNFPVEICVAWFFLIILYNKHVHRCEIVWKKVAYFESTDNKKEVTPEKKRPIKIKLNKKIHEPNKDSSWSMSSVDPLRISVCFFLHSPLFHIIIWDTVRLCALTMRCDDSIHASFFSRSEPFSILFPSENKSGTN